MADGIRACFRLLILVMLQLEPELPRADWITPSQVSTLEPLLGTLLGSPWCSPNHISLSFPIWSSYAWSINQRIHVFSMKMNWFQVVSRVLMAWSWLLLVLDWMGWRRKKWQLAKASQLSVTSLQLYVTWEMMEFQLMEEGFNPWWTCVIFWSNWTSWDLMGKGSSLVVLDFGWSAHVTSCYWNLCVSWAL